jgi:hypothetical protein
MPVPCKGVTSTRVFSMNRWILRTLVAFAALAIWAGLVGCGPITSTTTISSADLAIQSARLEGAEEFAIYEFVSAVEYLDKAREEWGYSDYGHAEEYAQRALDLAEAARERAMASPNRGLTTTPTPRY